MRVIHFAETLIGGPATHLNQLLPFQVDAYDSVSVFCPERHAHLIDVEGVQIIPFADTDRSPSGLLSLYRQWKAHLATHQYDIIHLHSSFAGFVGRLTRNTRETPIVYCARGWAFAMDISKIKKNAYALIERLLALRTDAIINISENEADLSRWAGIPQDKCHTIYNGIKDAAWEPLPENRRACRLLFVGRYDKQKGIDHLLSAMKTLSREGFSLRTIGGSIIGKPLIDDFPEEIIDLGWQDSATVQTEMNAADAIIIPSRWEGFGFVAAEAMRAGRPVVASNVGGLSEIVIDGVTGVLCRPDASEALIEGVRRLSNLNARELGIMGRQRFETHFAAERMFRQIDDIYQQTCPHPPRSHGTDPS
ncbi:MAG: glycosyltransferase [Rhizobiales bacterium]|nr:glycosyltransferase [Hyphomicrobiales bacterium]